ncbi:MAG: flippase-like domain-containing protein [Phycisphaeraceae bacterium]|nr:flippase-like domain-containing protein [Phycisphaeraceae bacterium]
MSNHDGEARSDPEELPEAAPEEIEAELEETKRQVFAWRRLLLQSIGFALGAALIIWLVVRAMQDPAAWQRLRAADPALVAVLLACSAISLALNGAIFWIAVQPLRRLGFMELQWVNAVAALFNYAPVRLGVFVRLAWHLRVDHMRLREVAAWFASIAYTVVVPLGAAIAAALLFGALGLGMLGVTLGLILVGGIAAPALLGRRFVQQRSGGLERVVTDPVALWGSLVVRSIDLGLWALRMMIVVRILGMELSASQSFMLAMAAMAVTLNPLGRLGFREATVAFVAARMLGGDGEDLVARTSQLAVIESAAELAVALPAGAVALIMLAGRWKRAKQTRARA